MKEEKDKIKNVLNENNPNNRIVNKVKDNEDDYNKLLRENKKQKRMMIVIKN